MRLIDADALYEKAELLNKKERVLVQGVLSVSPTIEAEPVRHGRWVPKSVMVRSPWARNHFCSNCKYEAAYLSDFCPDCGAKMGGDDHGTEQR